MLHKHTLTRLVALLVVVVLATSSSIAAAPTATSPPLGAAESFVVLAGEAVTNVPTSAITGDVGLSPAAGSNYAGLTTSDIVSGTIYAVDDTGPAGSVENPVLLTTAKTNLVTAYDALAAQGCDQDFGGVQDLSGLTLVPGVYCATAFELSGVLTLDGAATDVWVFKSASTLITSGAAEVVLSAGGVPCEVWWQVGSSATLGTNTSLAGNILALTSIGMATGANLDGRALARNGEVTLAQNQITLPICPLATPLVTTEIHNADHVEVFSAPIGTVVHDMAIISGTLGITPTGTVTFTVYHNETCAAPGTFAGAIPVVAGEGGVGVAHPSETATLTEDGLSYLAHYSGDENYAPANGPCEVLTVEPNAVELLYFRVLPLNELQVQLQWATALEVDNFGFNLYRANVNDVQSASLIHFEPASEQGGGSGATYSYVDTPPDAGRWWYWLADLDTYGLETLHTTPINIALQSDGFQYVYLPLIGEGSLATGVLSKGYSSR